MVERDQAVVKPRMAIRQLQIIHSPTRQPRLDKILQLIAPIPKTTPQRKRQIDFVQQFIARHQAVEHLPGISKLDVRAVIAGQLAPGPERPQRQKWLRRDEGIARG